MHRSVIAVVLSVVALFLLATISLPIAAGQDFGPLFPPIQVPAAPSITAPTSETPRGLVPVDVPQPALPTVVVGAPEEHWLVSTRNCRTMCRRCAAGCSLDFYRADKDCCTTRSSQPEFTSTLRPGVPVCIVVHGSYVTGDSVKEDCRGTFDWLRCGAPDRSLHVVFFTWPSDGIFTLDGGNALTSLVPGVDVAILGRRAETNGLQLAQLVNAIPSENPVCLIGHSHGARTVAAALHLLGGGDVQGLALRHITPHRIRTVFAAAAIDHDWLSPKERYGKALCTTECVINLRTRKDWALWFYPLRKPFSPASLGRKGFTKRDLQQLGDLSTQVAELDVTEYVGVGHIWPNYYEQPEISTAIAPLVYFAE